MSNHMTYRQDARAAFARPVQVLALCLITATGAAAQSTKARPHCTPVGGSLITNLVATDTTLGTATGDLRGAVSARLLGIEPGPNGTTVFTVQHLWVTEAGDTVLMDEAELTAVRLPRGSSPSCTIPCSFPAGPAGSRVPAAPFRPSVRSISTPGAPCSGIRGPSVSERRRGRRKCCDVPPPSTAPTAEALRRGVRFHWSECSNG